MSPAATLRAPGTPLGPQEAEAAFLTAFPALLLPSRSVQESNCSLHMDPNGGEYGGDNPVQNTNVGTNQMSPGSAGACHLARVPSLLPLLSSLAPEVWDY